MSGWETGWGLEFLVFMNNLGGRAADLIFEPFAFLGGEYGYSALLPLVFWCIDDRLGRRLFLLAMSSAMVNGITKIIFARPRPYQVAPDRIVPAHRESSYGLPSGHTQGGTVLGLFFIREGRKVWVKVLLWAFIVLMGMSRLIHGVHFLQDVLLGWILGGLVALAFFHLEKPVSRYFADASPVALAGIIALPMTAAWGLDALVAATYPATKSLLATGGALSGILLGLAFERRYGAFRSTGETWKRLARIPLGMAILLTVQFGLSTLFHLWTDSWEPSVGLSGLYTLRYLPVGFTGVFLVPRAFMLCRLGTRLQA